MYYSNYHYGCYYPRYDPLIINDTTGGNVDGYWGNCDYPCTANHFATRLMSTGTFTLRFMSDNIMQWAGFLIQYDIGKSYQTYVNLPTTLCVYIYSLMLTKLVYILFQYRSQRTLGWVLVNHGMGIIKLAI